MNNQQPRPKNILILDESGSLDASQQMNEILGEHKRNESSNIRIIDDGGEDEASIENSKSSDRNESYRNEWSTARAMAQRLGPDGSVDNLRMSGRTLHTERQKSGAQPSFNHLNSTQDKTVDVSREFQKPNDSNRSMVLLDVPISNDGQIQEHIGLGSPINMDTKISHNDKPFPRQISSPGDLNKEFGTKISTKSPNRQLVPNSNLNNFAIVPQLQSQPRGQQNLQSARSLSNLNESISTIGVNVPQSAQRQTYTSNGGHLLSPSSSTNDMHTINDLRRELRRKEQEFGKERAILKQQVQLLELHSKEFQLRESQMKQMHQSMLTAVQQSRQEKASQGSNNHDLREEYEDQINKLKKQILILNEELKKSQFSYQNLQIQMEEQEIEKERKAQELVLDKRNLENQIKRLQNQIQQASPSEEMASTIKQSLDEAESLRTKLNQQSQQHRQEVDKLKVFNEELEAQRTVLNEQITFLKGQVAQKEEQKELQRGEVSNLEERIKEFERQQEEIETQIDDLTNQLQHKDHEILQLQQSLDFNSSFEITNAKGIGGMSDRSMSMQAQRLSDENEYLHSQIRTHLNTIGEQKQQIAKYQNMENQSHVELEQKESQMRLIENEHKAKIKELESDYEKQIENSIHKAQENAEREIAEMKEQIINLKRQYEDQQSLHGLKLQEKDAEIDRLSQLITQLQLQFHNDTRSSIQHSPIRHNLSAMMASRDFQQSINGMQASQQNQTNFLINNFFPCQNISQISGTFERNQNQVIDSQISINPKDQHVENPKRQISRPQLPQSIMNEKSQNNNNQTLDLNLSNRFSQIDQNFQTTESRLGKNDDQLVTQEYIRQEAENGDDSESEEKVQIPISEFDLLQSCQKIIDAAFSMKCNQCERIFQTTDFYDHIIVQRECVMESEHHSHSQVIPINNTEGQILDSNYFEDLNNLNDMNAEKNNPVEATINQLEASQNNIMKSSLLKSIEDGDGFYDALNMPLQTNNDLSNYQTHQTQGQSAQKQEINCQTKQTIRESGPFHGKQQMDQSDSKQNFDPRDPQLLISNHKNTRESKATKTKRTNKAIEIRSRSGGSRGGNRSGMGASGTGMTVNSHILMSLSRSVSSHSDGQSTNRKKKAKQAEENKVNLNFKNEKDNICNLAMDYKLMTDEYRNDGGSEGSKTNPKSSARDADPAVLGDNSVAPENEINNYLTNTTLEHTKSQVPSQQPTSRANQVPEVSLNLFREKSSNINRIGLEDITSNEEEQKAEDEPHEANQRQPQVNLERLYDLDTSRFDEEFLNLPSSKKKQILGQIDEQSPLIEEEEKVGTSFTGQAQHQVSQSEQGSNYVDVSRFNNSHEMHKLYHESHRKIHDASEQSQLGAQKDKPATTAPIVAINLAPVLQDGKRKAGNNSQLATSEAQKQERCKDMPISLKDIGKRRNNKQAATAMGIYENKVANLNFFAKPSPKFQDDDMTFNFKMFEHVKNQTQLQSSFVGESQLVYAGEGAGQVPQSTQNQTSHHVNTSMSQNASNAKSKIKFDLSKQIGLINEQKRAKEEGLPNQVPEKQKKPDLKKAKSQTSMKSMIKKPILNIEIEDDYLKNEEENLNQHVRIEGLGLGPDFSQQNVMESFRNYQQRKQMQAQGTTQMPVIDVTQQFQSVSSKNGTQNFDFGNLTGGRSAYGKNFQSNIGPQPSSRRHAHGTNRYNKNGFCMVTSSSMDSGSQKDESHPVAHQNQAQNAHNQSPKAQIAEDQYDLIENKTIEQHERINREIAAIGRNNLPMNADNLNQANFYQYKPNDQKRIETSGFDIDINSPDNNRADITVPANNQTKAMEDIPQNKAGSEDLSQTATIEESSENDEQEQNDEIIDLLDMEQANQYEAGFQSHRHFLGKEVGLKPQLMSDQEAKMNELQQTIRDPAIGNDSDQHLKNLRQQIIHSQLDSEQPVMELTYQGTNLTEQQYMLHTKYSCNINALKGINQVGRRSSPKNSDYIKQSILLSGGKSARRYNMPRQQTSEQVANKIPHRSSKHPNGLMPTESEEDCNSFDEMDFDEDQAVIDRNQRALNQKQFQSTAPAPHPKLSTVGAGSGQKYSVVHTNRPITQKNLGTRRDPLKHSLFHSFTQTQRHKAQGGGNQESRSQNSQMKSYRDNGDEADCRFVNQFTSQYRTTGGGAFVLQFQGIAPDPRSRQQASLLSNHAQQHSYQSQGIRNMEGSHEDERIQKARPNTSFTAAHTKEGGEGHQITRPQSSLQKHKADAPGMTRSKSGLKKTLADSRAINQSVGVISRPMMNNYSHLHSPGHSSSMLQAAGGGAGAGMHTANNSAGQLNPAGKGMINSSSGKMLINFNLPRMMQHK